MRAATDPYAPPEVAASFDGFFRGQVAKNVFIMGRRDLGWSSTTILGDAAQYLNTTQALVNTQDVGTTYYLNSTSANDTAAGTGARTVRIVYLDTNGAQQVTTATLNGTTAVSLGAGFTYFQWMEVASVGSGTVSAGDLAITSINGVATVATTMEFIKAGGNRSLSGRYKVPTGYSAYLTGWGAHAISANMDTRLRATVFADDRTLPTVQHFQDNMYLPSGTSDDETLAYLCCPAGSEIKVSATPASAPAGNRLDCSFRLILIKNN